MEGWLRAPDEAGTWQFRYEVLAVADELAFVQGRTRYRDPAKDYSNLWVIRLNGDGRCSRFTEWWMQEREL